MKKYNPKQRILLWSTVVVLLSFCLLFGLFTPRTKYEAKQELILEPAVTSPALSHGVTPGQVTVYASPHRDSRVVQVLEADTTVAIIDQIDVNGEQWDTINEPVSGWILGSQMISASVSVGNLELMSGTVTADSVNCYAADNTNSAIVTTLNQDETIIVGRLRNLGENQEWGYVIEPIEGWVQLEAVQLEEDVENPFVDTAIVTENVNVHSAPNEGAKVVDMLQTGREVTIVNQLNFGGVMWAQITEPISGWVQAQYLSEGTEPTEVTEIPEVTEATAETAAATEAAAQVGDPNIRISPSDVRDVEIEWAAGDILIQPRQDIDYITFVEDAVAEEKYRMVWAVKQRKLTIEYANDNFFDFGIHWDDGIKKDLTIYVPWDWQCDSLEIDAAAANITVRDLVVQEVEFDGASGTCDFENCVVDLLDLDTASGDVTFSGTLKTLDCDAASAAVLATLDNVPSRIDMDSMSGDLDLTLPEGAGFTLNMNGMSSRFTSDFDTTMRNSSYVCGDGSCKINVDGMSSGVYIRKASPEAAASAIHQDCNDPDCTDATHNHGNDHH